MTSRVARAASACLFMVSAHVELKSGVTFSCYLMPWECLDRARQFTEMGAKAFSLHASGSDCLYWTRRAQQ